MQTWSLEDFVWTLSWRPPWNADTCNRLAHPLDVRCHHVPFQLQKGTVSLNVWPSVLWKTTRLCLTGNCSQQRAVWVAFSNLCLPPSVVNASYLIALGEEERAELLRNIRMEGSPLLLPAMHRSPLGLEMTPGPRVTAVALARLSPVLIRHIPSTQPRGLFPAGMQGCVKSANAGVHPGLLVAINLSSWVSFEACSCFYCKIAVKNFMEVNIWASTLPNLICSLIRGLNFTSSRF